MMKILTQKNTNDADQTCVNTFRPLNSSRPAQASQWSSAHIQRMDREMARLLDMVEVMERRGKREMYQRKYCAVMTLLNTTKV